jgi:HK97 family phage portal protein
LEPRGLRAIGELMAILERLANALGYRKDYAATDDAGFFRMALGMNRSDRPRPGNYDAFLDRFADQSWVYACVRVIQTKAAGVPLKVYRLSGEKPTEVPDHPLAQLLETVNPYMNGFDLREAHHGFMELAGAAYWLPDKVVDGEPNELYILSTQNVFPVVDRRQGLVRYEYRFGAEVVKSFQPEELVAFRSWNPQNPFVGMPPSGPSRDSADTLQHADRFNSAFFKNAAEPGGYLTTDKFIPADEQKRILEAWKKRHGGAGNARKTALIHNGLKYERAGETHQEMAFADLKNSTIRDVLAAFGVQPVMLGLHDDSNFANAREQRRAFWVDSIVPRLRKMESVLNERLAPLFGDDIYVEHDLSGVEDLQDDVKIRAETDQILTAAGIKLINEVRADRNLPPVEWGDTWNAPLGLTPIDQHAEPVAPPGEPVPAPAPGDPAPTPPEPKAASAEDAAREKGKLRRDAFWAGFKASTETVERVWFPQLRRLFAQQEREIVDKLRSHWEKRSRQARLEKFANVKGVVEVVTFDGLEARRVFRREGARLSTYTVAQGASQAINQNDFSLVFDQQNPRVLDYVRDRSFRFAEEVNSTTEEELRAELEEALLAGESVQDVEARIARIFDAARGYRTRAIARTEVVSAYNFGQVEAYEQSGLVDKIEWISSRDEKVRETHRIDGEEIELGQHFSNDLAYPGDPEGPPEEVIQCRCTTGAVVGRDR